MAEMKSISQSEANLLLKKDKFDIQDRFKLQSYVMYSLPDACKNLTYDDYSTIHILEEKNLYRILNTVGIITGVYGSEVQEKLLGLPACQRIISELRPDTDMTKRDSDKLTFTMIMRYALSGFSQYADAKPVFDGKMPQKLFQFRQQTADEWFDRLATQVAITAGSFYADLGLEEAMAYVMGYIAYYLNKTQPGKYGADITKSDNDNIMKILDTFISSVSGDRSVLNIPSFSTKTFF